MKRYILEAWLLLFAADIAMRLFSFASFCRVIGQATVRSFARSTSPPLRNLSHCVDCACVFYFKPVACLQRSAATTLLLRRHGWEAHMVIGARTAPFRSHAWVESENCVVNDSASAVESYRVLVRC